MSNVFDKIFKSNLEMAAGMGPPLPPSVPAMELANRMAQHQNDASLYSPNQAAQAQQGWASTQFDPIDELVKNPFQAAALYFRLRMTKAELKAKDIEVAFVRRMGGSVHCAIINQDRILTMIDEDVGAFPSDAFIARIRLLI